MQNKVLDQLKKVRPSDLDSNYNVDESGHLHCLHFDFPSEKVNSCEHSADLFRREVDISLHEMEP